MKAIDLLVYIHSWWKNFHVHSFYYAEPSEWEHRDIGTNRFIDGKEITKKQRRLRSKCKCGKYNWNDEWHDCD